MAWKLPDRPADPTPPNVDVLRARLERLKADRADKAAKAESN